VKKLGSKGRRWLLTFHIFFASVWIGTAISMTLIILLKASPPKWEDLYIFTMSVKVLDSFLIVPSAIGVLLTGLLISILTKWGFFKFYWVTGKWIITLTLIISGIFWLLPWLNNMAAISKAQRLLILQDTNYQYYRTLLLIVGSIQVLALANMILLTMFKPGRKK